MFMPFSTTTTTTTTYKFVAILSIYTFKKKNTIYCKEKKMIALVFYLFNLT